MSGLTPQEAADLLGVSTRTLLRWEEKGKITPRRTEGGHRRYDIYELLGNKAEPFFQPDSMAVVLTETNKLSNN